MELSATTIGSSHLSFVDASLDQSHLENTFAILIFVVEVDRLL
jgi:hypothetical protein